MSRNNRQRWLSRRRKFVTVLLPVLLVLFLSWKNLLWTEWAPLLLLLLPVDYIPLSSLKNNTTTSPFNDFQQLQQTFRQGQVEYCKAFLKDNSGNSNYNATSNDLLVTETKTIMVKRVQSSSTATNKHDNTTFFPMRVYVNKDIVSTFITSHGDWEMDKVQALVQVMQAFSHQYNMSLDQLTVVDIGANIGWYTLQLASIGVNVIAIEPFPSNVHLIRQSLCLNPHLAQRVVVLPTALSATNGHTCVLYSPDNNVGDGNLDCNVSDPTSFVPPNGYHVQAHIPCQRIDDLLLLPSVPSSQSSSPTIAAVSHPRIVAVKMDVEAHEPLVIRGGPRFFTQSYIPFFFTEFIPHIIQRRGWDAVGMLRTFCEANCTIRRPASWPWNCSNKALDPTTWMTSEVVIMDLYMECPSGPEGERLNLPIF